MRSERPNILLILSDQHSPHVLGCAGDDVVQTPHLDGLAARGVVFDAAYCPAPLCVPSRMSLMTGRHPCQNQVWTNAGMLGSEIPTFAHALGAAGYEVVLGGRMHFVGPDQRHGFERRLIGDVLGAFPGGPGPDLGTVPLSTTGQCRESVLVAGPGRTGYQAYDDAVTAECEAFLRNPRSAQDRPFCLVAGFVLPHCPFICPRADYEYYHDRVLPPRIGAEDMRSVHPAVRAFRETRGISEPLADEEIRRARAAYYGLVTYLDRLIGRLLGTLQTSGQDRHTVVVYASDHGEMVGEHGLWWKSNFYEDSARVPLIISSPGNLPEGERREKAVSLCDLGPTFIDLADADPLSEVAGESLLPLILEDTCGWRDEAFSELYDRAIGMPMRMVRRGPWKLSLYPGLGIQLFNLGDDPDEEQDRADDPSCASVRDVLLARVLEGWDPEQIVETVRRREIGNPLLRAWTKAVRPSDSDRWTVPPGSNVFPEIE